MLTEKEVSKGGVKDGVKWRVFIFLKHIQISSRRPFPDVPATPLPPSPLVKLLSWQTNKTAEDKEEDNLPLFLKIVEKLLAGLPGPKRNTNDGNTKDARSPRWSEVEYGSIHRGDWFFDEFDETRRGNGKRIRDIRLRRDSTAVRRRQQRKTWRREKIATDLENLEANLKGSTCAQRRKKHGVGTHSPRGEREETVNAFRQAQSNTPKNYKWSEQRRS